MFQAPWRGAGGRSCLVPTSNIHASAQMDPNILKRMLIPGSGTLITSQTEAAQAFALTSTSQLLPSLLAPNLPNSPVLAPAERGTPSADT